LFACDNGRQALSIGRRPDEGIDVLGGVPRSVNEREHRATIQRNLEREVLGMRKLSQTTECLEQAALVRAS